MKIASDTVVTLDYALTDDSGTVLDQSRPGQPLTYLHGHGQMVPGVEKALVGHGAGSDLKVTVAPADGYGPHDPENVRSFPRADMPPGMDPQVGMQVMARGPSGERVPVWIVKVTDKDVTFDGNHPLAGQTLHFSIQVRDVRQATPEEVSHGHAHGPGGHGHDHGRGGHDHEHGHGHGRAASGPEMPEEQVRDLIRSTVEGNRIAVFMKGTADRPVCGFSAAVVDILRKRNVPFADVNALQSPNFRHVLQSYSGWPTLPQVFVDGKLLGGADIIREMSASGELDKVLTGQGR